MRWMEKLEKGKDGKPLSTTNNFRIILENDFSGCFGTDEKNKRLTVVKDLPWRFAAQGYYYTLEDRAALRVYVETKYRMHHTRKLTDALTLNSYKNKTKWEPEI